MVSRIDRRPAVVCDDVPVTLSIDVREFEDLATAVRASGLSVTGPEPTWRFSCSDPSLPAGSPLSGALAGSDELLEEGEVPAPPVRTWMQDLGAGSLQASELSRADWLADHGFMPVGCSGPDGSVRVMLRNAEKDAVFVDYAEFQKSSIALGFQCRLDGDTDTFPAIALGN